LPHPPFPPIPKTIQIDTDNSTLTTKGYAQIKLAAIPEIEETTLKEKIHRDKKQQL